MIGPLGTPRYPSRGARLLKQRLAEDTERTQSSLERELGVTPGVVSRWLHEDRKPGRTMALRLKEVLGIDPESWDQLPDDADGTAA